MNNYTLQLQCMSNSGVVFWCSITIPGTDANDAVKRAIEHVIQNGAVINLEAGAPPVPIRPICAVPLRIEEAQLVQAATQMPPNVKRGLN